MRINLDFDQFIISKLFQMWRSEEAHIFLFYN